MAVQKCNCVTILAPVVLFILVTSFTDAYSPTPFHTPTKITSSSASSSSSSSPLSLPKTPTQKQTKAQIAASIVQKGISTIALTAAISISSSAFSPTVPTAYASALSDMGEDTVDTVLQSLKDTVGDTKQSFAVMETINDIITEGKGVGGSLSYKGVNLERGFVADEDTTIYNPGLSLMTESEKSSLVDGMIANRKANVVTKTWNEENESAFYSLKSRLDPLHMVELKGYLKLFPFVGGAMYVVALGIQQLARGLFEVGYVVSALVVFLPVFLFIVIGV